MGEKSFFTVDDLRKIQASAKTEAEELPIELSYNRKQAFIKPLKVKDKKSLMKAIETKNEKLIHKLFDNIVEKYVTLEDGISLDDITVSEKYQILTWIRRSAAGDTVKIIHKCPECEKVTTGIDYDLNNIQVKMFESDEENPIDNKIVTAGGKITLYLGPITRKDEKEIDSVIYARNIESLTERQFMHMVGAIKRVEVTSEDMSGDVDFKIEEKIDFFESLDSNVLDKINNYLRKIDHGVKMPFNFKCSHCGYENKTEMANITVFFIS
jgi:hypothetical protein